jgi:PAS domain S-box-containing protein
MSGVAVVGLDGEVKEVNAAFAEFFSPTRRWTEGMSYLSLLDEADQEAVKKELDSLARGERARFEAARRFLVREGVVKWAHTTATIIRGEDGIPDSILVVIEEAAETDR